MIHLTAFIRLPPRQRREQVMDDADDVLSALRLGWSVAERRGRNRPDGPPGEVIGMPDPLDHPLPLRIERGKTELRIEIQSVVAELARRLCLDEAPDGTSYIAALDEKTKLLAHARAPKAADALRQALDLLGDQQPEQALQALGNGLAAQRAVVARRRQALAAAQFARAPEAAVRTEQACCAGEEAGLAALEHVIDTKAEGQQGAIAQYHDELAAAARQAWADLA